MKLVIGIRNFFLHSLRFHIGYIALSSLVLLGVLLPRYIAYKQYPTTDLLGLSVNPGDYFQYVLMVKTGMNGSLFFNNVYDANHEYPRVIIQPLYNIIGMIGNSVSRSPFIVYFASYLLFLCIFLFMIYKLIRLVFPSSTLLRNVAFLLTVFSTSVWSVTAPEQFLDFSHTDFLNIYRKFNNLSPHHFLAIICFITILISLLSPRKTLWSFAKTTLLAFALGFIHPPNAMLLMGIIAMAFVLVSIQKRAFDGTLFLHWLVLTAIITPILFYHRYLTITIFQSDIAKLATFIWAPRQVSTKELLFGLGPIFFLAVPAMFMRKIYQKPIIIFLVSWIVVPLTLFYVNDLHIPINIDRLFQLGLHIPLAIFATLTIQQVSEAVRFPIALCATVVCVFFILYGLPAYAYTARDELAPGMSPYIKYYYRSVYTEAYPIMLFLRNHTNLESIVLSSTAISMMIPTISENRVVLGNEGEVPNFTEKLDKLETFYYGRMEEQAVRAYLMANDISYIVFGVGTTPFHQLPYYTLPFLKEIYRVGDLSVVQVKLSE